MAAWMGCLMADTQSAFNTHIKAYNSNLASGRYVQAAQAAAAASADCAAARNYDGAFKLLSGFEKVMGERHVSPDSVPGAYYYSARARFDLYDRMDNKAQAQTWLNRMAGYAKKTKSKEVATDMLFTEAKYYYATGNDALGDQCIARLIKQFDTQKDYAGADKAYRELIDKAVSANDAVLVEHTYEQYMRWSDSIEAANADTELAKVKQDMARSEETIQKKEHTILARTSLMTIFIVLFVAAVALLAVGTFFYQRIRRKNSNMRRQVEEAHERSAAKSAMMQNMASEMEPALERLPADDPAANEIRNYVKKVEEFSQVDASPSREEAAQETEQVALEQFCDSIVNDFRPLLKRGATIHVEGARGYARFDADEVRKILEHLVDNAVKFTPEGGRVTLTYKKRSATTSQFLVADSGPGIPESERENLFRPFNASHAISEGDGLGLPICALRAEKLGGSLTLDPTATHGTTFILTLH